MTVDIAELKKLAGERAAEWVESGMVVGLGTGSTAVYATRAIGQRLQDVRLHHILGIPTPKDDITGADVARVYYEDKDLERIAAYCKKDVVATAQLYLRLTGRELVAEERIAMV